MKCLVTGGAGFIGSNLVDELINNHHEVIVLDNLSTGNKQNINRLAKFYNVDITQMRRDSDFSVFEGVDVVFHLACLARVQPSIEEPVSYHDANVNGTVNILEGCRRHNVKRFIFSSSSSVYGDVREEDLPTSENSELNPMSPYALHKLVGEQYCKLYSELYGIETVCLRYFNVYGERQNTEGAYCLVMGVFAGQLLRGEPMTINGDGEQTRDFTYVGDVVNANVKCMEYPLEFSGDIFNVGAGKGYSVNKVADLLGGEKIHRDPVIEPRKTKSDYSKIQKTLDWKPTQDFEKWVTKWKRELGL